MKIDDLYIFMGCLPIRDVSDISNSVEEKHFLRFFFNNCKLSFLFEHQFECLNRSIILFLPLAIVEKHDFSYTVS